MAIVGIDEVGRGCWAGPLVAAAVLLGDDFVVPAASSWRLGDSKVLTRLQRQAAVDGLQRQNLIYGLGWVGSAEIDDMGLTKAVSLAMTRALNVVNGNSVPYDEVIIDGSFNFLPQVAIARTLVKADASVPAVSAASIIAKVARDNWMAGTAALRYPGYGFEKHVGYGTRQHRMALAQHGTCSLHRMSYKPVKAIVSQSPQP